MVPVRSSIEIVNSAGAIGFSFVRFCYDGYTTERISCLFLRDGNGFSQKAIIAPAETIKGLF